MLASEDTLRLLVQGPLRTLCLLFIHPPGTRLQIICLHTAHTVSSPFCSPPLCLKPSSCSPTALLSHVHHGTGPLDQRRKEERRQPWCCLKGPSRSGAALHSTGTAEEVAQSAVGCGMTYSVHCTLAFWKSILFLTKISTKGRSVLGYTHTHTHHELPCHSSSSGHTSGRLMTPILCPLSVGTNAQVPRGSLKANSKR